MDTFSDLLKIVIPSTIMLYGIYMIVKTFLDKQFDTHLAKLKIHNNETTLPMRLQAYERMLIFLERITPNNLLVRVNDPQYNAVQLQGVLIHEIREEYNHNISQQLYMSDQAWNLVRAAYEEIAAQINQSYEGLDPEAPGLELAKRIFQQVIDQEEDATMKAILFIKDEARQLYH